MTFYLGLSVYLLPFLPTSSAKGILASELSRFGIDYTPVENTLEEMKGRMQGAESDMGSAGRKLDEDPFCEKCVDDGTEVFVNRRVGTAGELYQGDMLLKPKQATRLLKQNSTPRSKRKVVVPYYYSYHGRWEANKPIPYHVHCRVKADGIKAVKEGIKHWEEKTCLRFVRRTKEQDYILFYNGSGCFSSVGREGGRQILSIGSGVGWTCATKGIVAHEIGHALGFFHEQSRPDRDKYVQIVLPNIDPEQYYNFEKHQRGAIDYFGIPYNYLSLMHYAARDFSVNHDIAIRTINPKYQYEIGNRDNIHPCDYEQMNNVYCRKPRTPQKDPIDCQESDWGPWRRCRNGCALRVRTRKVLIHPAENGNLCQPLRQSAICPGLCRAKKRHCQVTKWGPFSRCSKCGLGTFGTRIRRRSIKKNRRSKGRICPPLRQIVKCANQPCCRPNV